MSGDEWQRCLVKVRRAGASLVSSSSNRIYHLQISLTRYSSLRGFLASLPGTCTSRNPRLQEAGQKPS